MKAVVRCVQQGRLWVAEVCSAAECREDLPLRMRVPYVKSRRAYFRDTFEEAKAAALSAVGLAPEKEPHA